MSPTSDHGTRTVPHIVLLPSAGMGHLAPFTRLAIALSTSHGCDVSLVTALPTVSAAESRHLAALSAAFPTLRGLGLDLASFDASTSSEYPGADPFYVRYESLRRAAPVLLGALLADASALVADIALASVAIPVARELGVLCHVFFTASATMLAFKAYFPSYLVTEAARNGVPVLVWPRFADQRVNARVVMRCGAGTWTEQWSWEGEEAVVGAEEIAEKVKAAMADAGLTENATRLRDAAVRATADGGTNHRSLAEFVQRCRDGSVANAL